MDPTVIVCGLGRVGKNVVTFLHDAGVPIVVVDTKREPREPLPLGVKYEAGDCTLETVLLRAGVTTARGVIIVTSEDQVNVTAAMLARRLNPTCRIVVRMFNQNLLKGLGRAVSNTTALSVSALTAPLLAVSAVTTDCLAACRVQGQPHLMAEIINDEDRASSMFLYKLEQDKHVRVVGLIRQDNFIHGNDLAEIDDLKRGDRIIIYGATTHVEPLLATTNNDDGVTWASPMRRLYRAVHRVLGQVDLAVKLGGLALFLTLFIGTLVLRYAFEQNWSDAFYHTTSITATGAGLNAEDRTGPEKIFLSALKLVGAAIVAGFTALLTQYLIRMKLAGALEVGRIPDRGHVVVCGLGNVGFRVIEELHNLNVPVVAIEQDNDSPFAATVRRMGIPVILGDATVPAVLKQASCDKARSVVATAEAELVNLEIALLVREMNQQQRVVVRINDPKFAEALRDSASIRRAIALPAIAAPAFAAALWGDRIPTLATLCGRTFAIVECATNPGDALTTNREAAAKKYGYLHLGTTPETEIVMIETNRLEALLNRNAG